MIMARDQAIGWTILVASILVIIVYNWLLWLPLWKNLDIILLKLTATIAVIVVLGILAWIGYTLATTPPPKSIEEIEKKLEEELKKLEQSQEECQQGQEARQ